MRKRLLCLMGVVLALGICMPGGSVQAIADDSAEAQPVAAQDGALSEGQDAEELAGQAGSPDEDASQGIVQEEVPDEGMPQAAVPEEVPQEPAAAEDEQTVAPDDAGAPADEESQADATRAGPEEGAAPDFSGLVAASPLRASGASGFHATITSNKDSYSAGSTAIFAVKYTIDRGAFQEGDTVTVTIPTEVASKVRFSVDPLHFSSAVDKGDGTWELTFGPNADAALVGSFSMFITTAEVTEETTAPVTVGGDSKDLTVIPKGSAGGVGTYTDAIMKDVNDDKVSYGDYDYSEGFGDDAAQIGVYDSTNDENIAYRLFVNNKRATMDNITVVDTLPDGMSFDRVRGVRVTTPAGDELDPSRYSVTISGQTLTFTHPGTLTDTVWIYYWVNAKGGTGVKYTNRAEINYRSGGTTYQEHRNYVLQGNDYNAACGEKSVDKTIVSSDPADQRVTYTIKFWNSNGFDVGAINLTDKLDGHVRFVYADAADKFDVNYDEASHSVLISNTSDISGSETEYVRFVVDFSDVPEGYTVENTVGGNTTKTLKMPTVQLGATKTVDGRAPGAGQTFTFQLCDEQGTVLQEKQNDGGTVTFDRLTYSEDDLAADGSDTTIRYTVREKAGDDTSYSYDSTVYDVAVTLHRETGADGRTTVTATPAITKAGDLVDSMTFDNTSSPTSVTVSIPVSKAWVGPEGGPVTVRLLADGADTGRTLTLSADKGWADSFSGLPKYKADGTEVAYTVEEDPVEGYASEVSGDAASGFTVTNTSAETVDVTGAKAWDDDGDRDGVRPESITVRLLADGVEVGSKPVTEAGGWAFSFPGLPKYDAAGNEIAYTVTEDAVPNYTPKITGNATDGFSITNSHTPGKTSVTVTKAWEDGNDQDGERPDIIMVQLYADGVPSGDPVELSADNQWTHIWTGLDQKAGGQDVAYMVGEVEVPAGYTSEITGDAIGGYTITNSSIPETVSIPVTKAWVGPEGGPVTVHLLADGVDTGRTLTLSADKGWSDSFEGLTKYRDHGVEIAYSISEDVVEGYSAEITGDAAGGFTITNANKETVNISGTKTWDDDGDRDGVRPPSITVNLLQNGTEIDSKPVTVDDGWSYSFEGLAKYDEGGHEYVYTVTEDAVEGYATTIEGTDITNSHAPGKTSLTVTKAWDDANDQDGIRPDSIQLQLYADGEPSGDPVTLSADNQWTYTWADLFQREDGRDVAYTVGEVGVPTGYAVSVSGDATAGFAVTNKHVPEAVSVPVTKRWVGGEGGPVTVRLLADGVDTGKTLTLSADNSWAGSFDGLAKNAGGKAIEYTVSEDPVEGYTPEVSGDAASGFTITNTRVVSPPPPAPGRPGASLPRTGDGGTLPIALLLVASLVAFSAAALARRRASVAGGGPAVKDRHLNG